MQKCPQYMIVDPKEGLPEVPVLTLFICNQYYVPDQYLTSQCDVRGFYPNALNIEFMPQTAILVEISLLECLL